MKFTGMSRGLPPSSLVLLLSNAVTLVAADVLTGCSSQNTGTGSTFSIYMTNGLCRDTCNAKGSAFGITQYQTCWCSDVAPASFGNLGDCNGGCPGYGTRENCGNKDKGLYGYIKLNKAPTSTAGGDNSNSNVGAFGGLGGGSSSSSQQQQQTEQSSSSPPQTVVSTSVQTTTTRQAPSTVTSNRLSVATVSVTPSDIPTSVDTYTPDPSYITSSAVLTVSGAVVTQVVTSTASTTSGAQADSRVAHQTTKSGLSNGAVAGITIGAVAAAAILLLLLFFFWRRRRQQQLLDNDGRSSVQRTPSVMSKMGLLARTTSDPHGPASSDGPTLPQITTTIAPGQDPASASTNMSENRRNSRPIFVDSRLNPNAIMLHNDHSRTSIATLQDNQDYSRPLEVRNPD